MSPRSRDRWKRTLVGGLAAVLAASWLALPAPAAADERRGRHERHDRKERHERHERKERHERHSRYERHERYERHGHRGIFLGPRFIYRSPFYGHRSHHHGYYCRPCGHRYHSSRDLHWHVHQHHHVPLHVVPTVIFQVDFGWIFNG